MRSSLLFIASVAVSAAAITACGASSSPTSTPGGATSATTNGGTSGPAPSVSAGPSTTTTDTLGDAGDLDAGALPSANGSDTTDTDDDGGTASGDGGGRPPAHSKEELKALVKAKRKEWRACYHDAVKANPNIPEGKLVLHFEITQQGVVDRASLGVGSDISEPAVLNCIIGVVQGITFPPSANGRRSIVNYPFIFKK